jgi:limonene-1,2-epoxide hydrolase
MPAPAEIVARFQAAVQRDGPDATVHYRGTQCYVI